MRIVRVPFLRIIKLVRCMLCVMTLPIVLFDKMKAPFRLF